MFTPKQAGAVMRRARKLLRAGEITHHQFALLDCLTWTCRPTGSDRTAVSYTRLQQLAGMARETVRNALRRFEDLGLLRRIKRRVRVLWGGALASRQATNIYVLLAPDTEFAPRPVLTGQGSKKGLVDKALNRLGVTLGTVSPAVPGAAHGADGATRW